MTNYKFLFGIAILLSSIAIATTTKDIVLKSSLIVYLALCYSILLSSTKIARLPAEHKGRKIYGYVIMGMVALGVVLPGLIFFN